MCCSSNILIHLYRGSPSALDTTKRVLRPISQLSKQRVFETPESVSLPCIHAVYLGHAPWWSHERLASQSADWHKSKGTTLVAFGRFDAALHEYAAAEQVYERSGLKRSRLVRIAARTGQ